MIGGKETKVKENKKEIEESEKERREIERKKEGHMGEECDVE